MTNTDLEAFFDQNSYRELFLHRKIDEIPSILNNLIFKAWNTIGIVKFVNSSSKPWHTKVLKSMRRRARSWERQRNKARRNDGTTMVDNITYLAEDCESLRRREQRAYVSELSKVMCDCDEYADGLLDQNILSYQTF